MDAMRERQQNRDDISLKRDREREQKKPISKRQHKYIELTPFRLVKFIVLK